MTLGIAAVQINSAVPADEVEAALAAIAAAEVRIVFTTPERLADPDFVAKVATHPVSLLVVDEAHCISRWGHDFRPAFLEIGAAIEALGRPTILALTATASPEVVEDIARQLGGARFRIVNTGMYRPNLHYCVEQVTREGDKLARLVEHVRDTAGSGLVYVATVKAADLVHAALAAAGESVARYHGRLGAAERRENQEAFMRDEVRVMVATNAFGLGIDKPDIRFVLHYQMPAGLDAYYQESGRAGRDGAPALCTLLYLHSDKAVQQLFLARRYPALEDLAAVHAALGQSPPANGENGTPSHWTLERLHAVLDRPESKIQVALRLLRHQRVVAQDRAGRLTLQRSSLDTATLESLATAYRDKREADRAMLEQMVSYGQTGYCRWKVLLGHFHEDHGFERCGTCDNCLRLAALSLEASATTADDVTLAEAAAPAIVYPAGVQVRVPRYGSGVVEQADSQSVTVGFPNGSSRCFLAAYVQPAA